MIIASFWSVASGTRGAEYALSYAGEPATKPCRVALVRLDLDTSIPSWESWAPGRACFEIEVVPGWGNRVDVCMVKLMDLFG